MKQSESISAKRMKKSIIGNVILAALEFAGLSMSLAIYGLPQYQYFTELTNLLSLITSVLYCIFGMRSLKQGDRFPVFIRKMRYVVSVNLFLIFFVCIIGGIIGYSGLSFSYIMFSDCSLFLHFFCPITSTILLLFLEKDSLLEKKQHLWSCLPALLYSVIIIPLNYLRIVHGPYTFLYVYEMPFYALMGNVFVILALAFALSLLFGLVKKKISGGALPAATGEDA